MSNASSASSAVSVPHSCFHCGLPLPVNTSWSVVIDGIARAMCCPGCAAVSKSIVDHGLTDYYHSRTEYASTASEQELIPPELHLYDHQPAPTPNPQSVSEIQEACYSVQHIHCPACIWLIEHRLARLLGVISVEMNAATERLYVQWQESICKPSDILAAMRAIGYPAYPFDPFQHGAQLERNRKSLFRQLFIAGLSMMQVMMYAVPLYLANDGTMDDALAKLMRWASLLLTLPAVLYSAQPFFRGAWRDMRNRMPGMDVPVALAIAAAFIGSAVATWQERGDVYFDSITMCIFLLLCSRYLELTARRKAASTLDSLQQALPAAATRMLAFPMQSDSERVAADQLRVGDVILVKPGEVVPVDCVIVEGESAVDVSLLTGESAPQRKVSGDQIAGGTVNTSQPLMARVLQTVDQSTLSVLLGLIRRAGQGKPRLMLWADRVAAWFVVLLLFFSLAIFCLWYWIEPARAWPVAIAVLVVSCPCALSLAMPTTLAAATNRLLRQGILVVQPHVLETLQRATHIVFDKTGTLTQGRPSLQTIVPLAGLPTSLSVSDCLRIAAAMERFSSHPIAQTLCEAAKSWEGIEVMHGPQVEQVRCFTGQGVEAMVDGVCYRLGNFTFVRDVIATTSVIHPATSSKTTQVFLASGDGWLACFEIVDAIRPEAHEVVEHFQQQGKKLMLLSGDHHEVAQRVADKLGIAAVHGDCLPEHKLSVVQRLQQQGAVVAMVGDGINDAAVLRAADVSFAMGGGAALAQIQADCVLLSGEIAALQEIDRVAAKTLAVIRQNLWWATLYNMVAIPAAALGWINPWLSGIGMSMSSAVVVLNALRLRS